jgi:hypothetical protein
MFESIIRPLRALAGIWNELRRFNRNLEWIMSNHPAFDNIGLPPSRSDIKNAEREKIEHMPVHEEVVASERALEILRRRARGESIEGEPGEDFDIYS